MALGEEGHNNAQLDGVADISPFPALPKAEHQAIEHQRNLGSTEDDLVQFAGRSVLL
jgi:hypothetical protein